MFGGRLLKSADNAEQSLFSTEAQVVAKCWVIGEVQVVSNPSHPWHTTPTSACNEVF